MSLPVLGTMLAGRYRLDRMLGRGGMGAVYEALEVELGRRVAVKVMLPSRAHDEAFVARLRREAMITAGLRHPNIVQTTALVEVPPDPPFVVMEHVEGVSLQAILEQQGALDLGRVARIGLQVLDALGVAHAAGIVHRDLKPANLLLTSTPAIPELVKLLDFGIAKVLDEERFTLLTQSNAMIGTPGYMAPEQATGRPVDARTDLYSVGVLLFRLVAGKLPYHAEGASELLVALLRDPPVPLGELRPDLPAPFAALLARALQKDPRLRFQSAMEMAEALAPFVHAVPAAAAATLPWANAVGTAPVPTTRVERKRSRVALTVIVTLAALASGIGVAVMLAKQRSPSPSAPVIQVPSLPALPPPDATIARTPAADAAVRVALVDAEVAAAVVDAAVPVVATPDAPARPSTGREPTKRVVEPRRRSWSVVTAGLSSEGIEDDDPGERFAPGLRMCLDRQAPVGLEASLVVVRASIQSAGHVADVAVASNSRPITDPAFLRCLRQQYASLTFRVSTVAGERGSIVLSARVR